MSALAAPFVLATTAAAEAREAHKEILLSAILLGERVLLPGFLRFGEIPGFTVVAGSTIVLFADYLA